MGFRKRRCFRLRHKNSSTTATVCLSEPILVVLGDLDSNQER